MVVVVDWIGLFCLISLSFCLVLLPFSVAWCGLQRSPVMVLNILWVRHPLTEKKLNLRHWPDSSFFFFPVFHFSTFNDLLQVTMKQTGTSAPINWGWWLWSFGNLSDATEFTPTSLLSLLKLECFLCSWSAWMCNSWNQNSIFFPSWVVA